MKTRTVLLTIIFSATLFFAQNKKDHLFTIDSTDFGGYAAFNARYSTLCSDPVGFADIKLGVTLDGKWVFGLSGSALYYDKKLDNLVNDGTYHLNIGYVGIFVERIFTINDDFKLALSITSGSGEAFYRYDKEYRKDKVWTEEVIDKTTFAVFEPGIELQHRLSGNWWIGLVGTYRNTSPVELIDTDKNLLRKFSTGISIKWGIF